MKKYLKKIVIYFLVMLTIIAWVAYLYPKTQNIGGTPITTILDIKNNIDTLQNNYSGNKNYKKYREIAETYVSSSNLIYRVDEYVIWDGKNTPDSSGYQIYFTDKNGLVMSTGTGKLSKELSFDWTKQTYDTTTQK